MSEKSDMPVGDRSHQPDRLVLRHPVYMSDFGDLDKTEGISLRGQD
jgi:hypothetical protein